jgi:hypothetical protein
MSKIISVQQLTEKDLGKAVSLKIPFDEIKGELTDFYGSFDEDVDSIIVVEINEEPYILENDLKIEIF